jgi:hypothetical protein
MQERQYYKVFYLLKWEKPLFLFLVEIKVQVYTKMGLKYAFACLTFTFRNNYHHFPKLNE